MTAQAAFAEDIVFADQLNGADVETWKPPYLGELPPEEPQVEHHLPTAAEVAAIEQAAREAGHAAGFDQGLREGRERGQREAAKETRAKAERELKAAVAALESIAAQLSDPLASAADDIEPELLLLVTTLAQRVIMTEIETRAELVQGVLHQALDQLPSRRAEVRVTVNPEDLAMVESYAEDHGETIRWLADPQLTRGGCVVESGPSRIDATIEARLVQAVDAIWGELTRPDAGPDAGPAASPSALAEDDADSAQAEDSAAADAPTEGVSEHD